MKLPPEVVSKRGGPVKQALAKGARMLRNAIKAAAPVDKGFLRANIIATRGKVGAGFRGEKYVVRVLAENVKYKNTRLNRNARRVGTEYELSPAYYWRFLEYGTKKMAAKPFIRPTGEANAQAVVNMVSADLVRRVDLIVKKLGAAK